MERDVELEVIGKLGELKGQFEGVHQRLESMEIVNQEHQKEIRQSILNGLLGVTDKLQKHEDREEPRLKTIERLVWVAVGGVAIIAGGIAFMWPNLQHAIGK